MPFLQTSLVGDPRAAKRAASQVFKAAAQAALMSRENYGHYQPPSTITPGALVEPEEHNELQAGYLTSEVMPGVHSMDSIADRVSAWASDTGNALQRAFHQQFAIFSATAHLGRRRNAVDHGTCDDSTQHLASYGAHRI